MEIRWMGRKELKTEENPNKRKQTRGKPSKHKTARLEEGQKEASGKKTQEKKEKGGGEGAKLDHNWVFMQKVVLVFCAIKVEKQIRWNLRKYKL